MPSRSLRRKALDCIERDGIVLVFPIDNRKQPHSLWSEFYPKSPMIWDWDASGDRRVEKLWHLKTELSESREVIYTKWYRNRATFFSKNLFAAVYKILGSNQNYPYKSSSEMLEYLDSDSPVSTKTLKAVCDLQGRANETLFNKSMRPLWDRLQIVAFGEFDDSSFPSLGIGSSRTLFEDVIADSEALSVSEALELINRSMPPGTLWRRYFDKLLI